VVFHGELGENCSSLVRYFESRGAERIQLGDNPANWMLRLMDSDIDFAESYIQSTGYSSLRAELEEIESSRQEHLKIDYSRAYATSFWSRQRAVNQRLRMIYWRSPSYNHSRLIVSIVIGAILGSSFILERNPVAYSETDMRSRVSGM